MAPLRGPLSLSHPTMKNRERTTVPSGLGKAKGKIRMEVCWLIAELTARHGFSHQRLPVLMFAGWLVILGLLSRRGRELNASLQVHATALKPKKR